MCGRFENRINPNKLAYRYGIGGEVLVYNFESEYAPTMMAPVIIPSDTGRTAAMMKWGYLPPWATEVKEAAKCFNARAETVTEKPTFREAFKNHRCLVPVTGFYEWRAEEGQKRKTKYRFNIDGDEIFSLAGLWTPWKSPDGVTLLTFTILTTSPNELMAQYHKRMPVILHRDEEEKWLRLEIGQEALIPYPTEKMGVERADESSAA